MKLGSEFSWLMAGFSKHHKISVIYVGSQTRHFKMLTMAIKQHIFIPKVF